MGDQSTTELIINAITKETGTCFGQRDLFEQGLDKLSIDDFLRGLIEDSDLKEVVAVLDLIAEEDGKSLKMYDEQGTQIYPVP